MRSIGTMSSFSLCLFGMGFMDLIPLKPERKAQLEEYAHRHAQDPAAALDDALAAYLERERQAYLDAVEGTPRGYQAVKVSRTFPAAAVRDGIPRQPVIPR